MKDKVEELHEQLMVMGLGDLLLLAGQAVNLPMPDNKVEMLLKYVEVAIWKWKMKGDADE